MNKENLLRLADYLEGPLKAAFDMSLYSEFSPYSIGGQGVEDYSCGSVGCAVGHSPFIGLPKSTKESWRAYAGRVFGLPDDKHFNFLFSGLWGACHNDPKETARRIRYFVKHGMPAWDMDYKWTPPADFQPTPQQPKTVYKFVWADQKVKEMTEQNLCEQ